MTRKKIARIGEWIMDGTNDLQWSWFLSRERSTVVPKHALNSLFSITPTLDEDGEYRGSVILKGYAVVPVVKESRKTK